MRACVRASERACVRVCVCEVEFCPEPNQLLFIVKGHGGKGGKEKIKKEKIDLTKFLLRKKVLSGCSHLV